MTTYKEIVGGKIKKVTDPSDPTPAANYEGEMWYNSTIGNLKVAGKVASAWSSGGGNPSSSPATGGIVGFGAQTAAVLAGGTGTAPSPVLTNAVSVVQEYNGSSWTTVNSMSQVRTVFGGTGPQTSSVFWWRKNFRKPFYLYS